MSDPSVGRAGEEATGKSWSSEEATGPNSTPWGDPRLDCCKKFESDLQGFGSDERFLFLERRIFVSCILRIRGRFHTTSRLCVSIGALARATTIQNEEVTNNNEDESESRSML